MSSNNFKLYRSLGQIIKDYRQWKKISQDEFAESIKVSVRQLRRWEAGFSHTSTENLQDIAQATGIPMEACITLNAGNPIWYFQQKRKVAYTLIEANLIRINDLLKNYKQSDRDIPIEKGQIITDKNINKIISYHCDSHGTKKPLSKNVLMKAINILPDMNRIIFDNWGLMVGYTVCLPVKLDTYEKLKKQKEKVLEDYLITENISDIKTLNEGVFFHYSNFSANLNVAYSLMVNNLICLSKIKRKERYLAAFQTATKKGKEFFIDLGMRNILNACNSEELSSDNIPLIFEIELDSLVKCFNSYTNPVDINLPLISGKAVSDVPDAQIKNIKKIGHISKELFQEMMDMRSGKVLPKTKMQKPKKDDNLNPISNKITKRKRQSGDDYFMIIKQGIIKNEAYRNIFKGPGIIYEWLWANLVRSEWIDTKGYPIKKRYYDKGYLAYCSSFRKIGEKCFLHKNKVKEYIDEFKKAGIIKVEHLIPDGKTRGQSVFILGEWKNVNGKIEETFYRDEILLT